MTPDSFQADIDRFFADPAKVRKLFRQLDDMNRIHKVSGKLVHRVLSFVVSEGGTDTERILCFGNTYGINEKDYYKVWSWLISNGLTRDCYGDGDTSQFNTERYISFPGKQKSVWIGVNMLVGQGTHRGMQIMPDNFVPDYRYVIPEFKLGGTTPKNLARCKAIASYNDFFYKRNF